MARLSLSASFAQRHRFAAALCLAAFVHAGLWVVDVRERQGGVPKRAELVELDLTELQEESPAGGPIPGREEGDVRQGAQVAQPLATTPPPPHSVAPNVAANEASEQPGTSLTALEPTTTADSPEGSGEQATTSQGKRQVRLFLGQDELSKLTERFLDGQRKPRPDPSAVLDASLRVPDADRAASPVSPAVSAGYHAAEFGPKSGTAVLEVRADAEGRVISVLVVGSGQNGPWAKVADELRRRLLGSRLRMREGAQGLVARLRIERGKFTRPPGTMKKLKAAPAIGQESRTFAQDQARAGLHERNGVTPALGVNSSWLQKSRETKVSVLGLSFL